MSNKVSFSCIYMYMVKLIIIIANSLEEALREISQKLI